MNISLVSSSSYASQIISQAQQKQGDVLIRLITALNHCEVAQAKPLANLGDTSRFDAYA